jgi:hypothetical protein
MVSARSAMNFPENFNGRWGARCRSSHDRAAE